MLMPCSTCPGGAPPELGRSGRSSSQDVLKNRFVVVLPGAPAARAASRSPQTTCSAPRRCRSRRTEIAGNHSIFVATTRDYRQEHRQGVRRRALVGAQLRPRQRHRAEDPQDRPDRAPQARGKPDDPPKFFIATDVVAYDTQPEFSNALSADIAARGGRAMVFVHGYNTAFDDAVYRMTQIAMIPTIRGTPVLFSWASGGRTTDYVYDKRKRQRGPRPAGGDAARARAVRRAAHRHRRAFDGHLGDHGGAAPAGHHAATATSAASSATWCSPRPTSTSTCSRARCAATASPTSRSSCCCPTTTARCGCPASLPATSRASATTRTPPTLPTMASSSSTCRRSRAADSFNHTKFADNPELVKLLGQRLREDDGFASDRVVPTASTCCCNDALAEHSQCPRAFGRWTPGRALGSMRTISEGRAGVRLREHV